ncbi:hypothetical protein ETD83_05625 [Actinomadura soli]|uniref:Uncharacterized protein n=1 Tax=Actinomadura soli TaxID=2508997 RepID=A0A5C4JID7_9ACTN|nr:SAV_2336 N-terminal domain-related protein [Actinomadura soli]TMR05718.1 hypothetical protein ETD83_05625 [Actinomadura soli]
MIGELARALARLRPGAGEPLTADQITDVLRLAPAWLASQPDGAPRPASRPEPPGHRRDPPAPGPDGDDSLSIPLYRFSDTAADATRSENGASGDASPPDTSPDRPSASPLEPPQTRQTPADAATKTPASGIGIRPPPALPHSLELTRALRRFKQVTHPGRPQVDIDASVQATAHAAGRFVVVMTRPPERALDLALVVDSGPSMQVWDRTFDELELVLAQVGAFRTISRWSLDSRGDRVRLEDTGGRKHPVSRLVDPSGSRLVLIATDGVGDGWYGAKIWRALDRLASSMPTAILQILARDYWAHTAIGRPYVITRAPHRGAPNSQYETRRAVWAGRTRGHPLPIVALSPEGLEHWAQAAVSGTAWTEGITTAPPLPDRPPTAENRELGHGELVRTFLSRASSGGIRLAKALAAAPVLDDVIMDVIQAEVVPGTGIGERAELAVSGLLERTSAGLRFTPEAAEALQDGATVFEQWDIYEAITRYLEEHGELGRGLSVLAPHPQGRHQLDARHAPLAAMRERLAGRLGFPPDGALPATQPTRTPASKPLPASKPVPEPPPDGVQRPEAPEIPEKPKVSKPPGYLTPPAVKAHASADLLPAAAGGPPPPARPARDVLADAIAETDGSPLNVVDVGEIGIAATDVRRDARGAPFSRPFRPVPWADLGGVTPSRELVLRAARLRPEASNLFVCSDPGHLPASRAMGLLREAVPDAPAVAEPGIQVDELLRAAIIEDPIQHRYDLVVLRRDARTGALRLGTVALFRAGARRGDTATVIVNLQPSGGEDTILTIVTTRDGETRLVEQVRAPLEPGRHTLVALLDGPGRVSFRGLNAAPDLRSWSELVAQLPHGPIPASRRAHVICAVEVAGPAERVAERLGRVRQIVTTLGRDAPPGIFRFSLIGYGEHSFDGNPPRRQIKPLPFSVWQGSPQTVLAELARFEQEPGGRRAGAGYPLAAMVEDMLDAVVTKLRQAPADIRTVLLTIGERRPHPPTRHRSQVLPCPRRLDYEALLQELRASPGMTLAAICDLPADRADRAWRSLSDGRPAHLEAVDVREFLRELELSFAMPAHPSFPMAEDA